MMHKITTSRRTSFHFTLELSLNLLELDPAYPKEPHTFGERIRKARMDRGMMIKELAELVGVTEDTIINWEVRGVRPTAKVARVREVLGFEAGVLEKR